MISGALLTTTKGNMRGRSAREVQSCCGFDVSDLTLDWTPRQTDYIDCGGASTLCRVDMSFFNYSWRQYGPIPNNCGKDGEKPQTLYDR